MRNIDNYKRRYFLVRNSLRRSNNSFSGNVRSMQSTNRSEGRDLWHQSDQRMQLIKNRTNKMSMGVHQQGHSGRRILKLMIFRFLPIEIKINLSAMLTTVPGIARILGLVLAQAAKKMWKKVKFLQKRNKTIRRQAGINEYRRPTTQKM